MPARRACAVSTHRTLCLLVLALGPILCAPGPARAASVDYVIEISVDGLGSSYLQGLISGNALPNFRRLQLEGAWTLNARNDTGDTTTLPNHTTMLTGRALAGPEGHNYTDDGTPGAGVTLHTHKGSYVASAFDVAHDNGLSTALFANKSKFSLYRDSYNASAGAPDLIPPDDGTAKLDMYTYAGTSATFIMPAFLDAMSASPLQFSFLHMRDPDTVGHASGWGTPAYNDALKTVDACLGNILDLVEASPLLQGRTAIVLTADHGGRGTSHSSITEPLDYTIPFFVWGPGVAANSDLYGLSAAARLDPGTGKPAYSAPVQPIRNGDIANLGLALLSLGPVPGSTINAAQDLAVAGSAPAREVIAYSAFNEAPTGAADWTRDLGETELAFATASTPQGGSSSLAGTYSSTTSPLRYRITSSLAETAFEPVTLRGYEQVEAAIDILVKNTTYHLGDYFSVTLTDGTDTIVLAGAAVDASGDTLNTLSKNVLVHYAAAIPATWTTATLRISASNHLDTEDMDFDNLYFTGLPLPPATLRWTGAADRQWGPVQRANWSAAGEAQAYRDGDHVVLDDAAGAGPVIL
ncbi:MAG: alkaline phosphatase family protein, partial [Acidobacteria bacterium]|nr:alkaline phosphatase family protein [Acidobacteriota bacterium]